MGRIQQVFLSFDVTPQALYLQNGTNSSFPGLEVGGSYKGLNCSKKFDSVHGMNGGVEYTCDSESRRKEILERITRTAIYAKPLQ